MAFIVNLKPVEIERIQRRLQKERDKQARQLAISRETKKGIQENPVKRNQFSID